MPELLIGKAGTRKFFLPLDVAQWAMAIHGVRGKGKTNTGVVIVEEALDQGVQVIIIDPTDVWWGLKSTRDGKRAGYPVVILGGEKGDLPLVDGSGAAIADFAVENRVPMILSLRHFRKGSAQRFVQDFAEQLYHRKGESVHRRPLLLVMDEASRFVPQRVQAEQARLVGAIEDIVRQGRASGFGTVLIDQRPASVNKDVLTQIELLVCHAVTSPQDRKALDEWIQGKDSAGHRAEFLEHLAGLGMGEAWFWLPMADLFERVQVRERRTFDSSRTPEIGESMAGPERFAQVDLGVIRAQLEHAVEQAIANDPKTLRRRIVELERELAEAGGVSEAEVAQRIEQVVEQMQEVAERQVDDAIHAIRTEATPHLEALQGVLANGKPPARSPIVHTVQSARRQPRPEPSRPAARHSSGRARPVRGGGGAGLGRGERAILTAIAQHDAGVTREQLTVLTGYRRSSRDTYLQRLIGGDHVIREGDVLKATEIGIEALGDDFEPLPTGDALRAHWLGRLGGGERKILEVLCNAYPEWCERAYIDEMTGYQRSSRDTYLQKLSARRLIEVQRGGVRASEQLFSRKGRR